MASISAVIIFSAVGVVAHADELWSLSGATLTATSSVSNVQIPAGWSMGNFGVGTATPVAVFNVFGGQTLLQPSSATTSNGVQIDTGALAAGSNALLLNAPLGWTGNFLFAAQDGAQIFKLKHNGQATFARGVDIKSGCFSMSGVCINTSGGPTKTRLTNSTTFYVSTTGSDSNDGKTSGTAWATMQHAWNTIKNDYDLWGQQVVIQVADGTYTHGMQAAGNLTGDYSPQQVTVRGNVANPANVLIKPTSGPSFDAAWGAMYAIEGFKMDHTNTHSDMVMVGQYSTIALGKVEFGYNIAPYNHVTAGFLAHVIVYDSYKISGGAQTHMDVANDSSVVWPTDCNAGLFAVDITNNPLFSAGFIFVASNAQAHVQNITFNGTARGPKFVVEGNGVIDTCISDLNYLPGNEPGIIRAGGQYLPVTKNSAAAEFGQAGQVAFYQTDGTIVNGSTVLQVDVAGRVGINAAPTPGVQLNIRNNEVDSAVVRVGGPSHYLQLGETGLGGEIKTVSNGIFAFGTSNTERLRISADGKIGIGTTNPSAKLDVAGSINVGSANSQKGITLYDTTNGSPYCIRITAGVLLPSAGACAN